VDSDGNVCFTGGFRGSGTFGTNVLSSFGSADIFVSKYSPTGSLLWVRQAGGNQNDNGSGIGVDAENNVYVTGYFRGTASFGTTNVVSQGDEDVFVAKYSPDGTLLWVWATGGTSRDQSNSLAVDSNGNVCITGMLTDTSTTSPYIQDETIFVTKLDKNGNLLWTRSAGGYGYDSGFGVAADHAGNIYVTGYVQYDATFGTLAVPAVFEIPFGDIFLAKYDSDGTSLWVRRPGGNSTDYGKAVAVDRAGNVYIAGKTEGPTFFDSLTLSSGGCFIAKYSSSGEIQWTRLGGYANTGNAVACDPQGNIYWAADLMVNIHTEGGYGGQDITVTKYDTNGNKLWFRNAGSPRSDIALAIALDSASNVYLAGIFRSASPNLTARFDDLTLTSSGPYHYNNFVAKLESDGVPLAIRPQGEKLKLSWSPLMPGLSLQYSTNLLQADAWVTLPNGTNGVEVPFATGGSFFRLVR
jgi:hypothetical protein